MEANENIEKNAGFYLCENCDFKCSKLSNFNTHVTTAKHKRLIISCQKMPKNFIVKNVTLHAAKEVIGIRIN